MAEQDSNGLVIHVSSLNDRSTEVVMRDRISIGACEDCDVKIRLPQIAAAKINGPVLELARVNGAYRITSFASNLDVKLNNRSIRFNRDIEDGDEVWIGPSGPSIHFFPIAATEALVPGRRDSAHVAPFIEQAAMEASATARRDDAKIFLREFTRELVREMNPSTKIIALTIFAVLVLGILYLGFATFTEIRRSRRTIADQSNQLQQVDQQLAKANEELSALGRDNQNIRNTLSIAVKLHSDYGDGVCLIAGSFIFVESGTGRPLRYPETQTNDSGASQSGSQSNTLTPEGRGPVAEFEFVGTGFHVGDGFVLTNRHVAQPWLADDRAQSLNSSVSGQPRLKKFMAFFPDQPQSINLKVKQAASREDVAVCTVDAKDLPPKLPVLPLEKESESVVVGKMVVTMGYPSGPDRLLAMFEPNEARAIQARYGSLEAQLNYFAETKHIQPLTTQGNITAGEPRKIVYDARTGEGGSGGPLFGPSGRVIGITYAMFTENTASNFAVPIRYAISLLEKSGWTAPSNPEAEQKEGANIGQTNSRGLPQVNSPR